MLRATLPQQTGGAGTPYAGPKPYRWRLQHPSPSDFANYQPACSGDPNRVALSRRPGLMDANLLC
jgi:hypothetical protein